MTISLKHSKTSTVPDSGDTTLVQPSDWNSEHTLSCASGKIIGRSTTGVGNAEEITIGAGLSLSGGELSATDAGGTVTSVSVVTANGLAGSVANQTTTPAITLSTTVTGLLKGNGTAISAASSGTDYAPATSGTAILKGNGSGGFANASAGTDYVSPSVLGAANGVATLGSDSKLTSSQIPDISIVTYLGVVASQSAMLALTGQQGDWCTRSDLGTNWIITGANPALLASWTQLSYPTAPVTSVNTQTGAVVLSAANVGAQPAITVNGIIKGNGSGTLSAATSGTDYAPATSGTSILKGNGSGGFSNASAGTDYAAANASFTLGSTSVSLGGTTSTVAGLTLTNPTINGFTGDTSVVNIGSGQFYKDTSGNVGIGTSSPAANLTVAGGTHLRGYTAPNTSFASLVLGITGGEAYVQPYTTGVTQIPMNLEGSTVKINTGGSTRVTIDSSGNLGLGVTPSAWYSTFKAFEMGAGSIASTGATQYQFLQNAYVDSTSGGYTYKATAQATRYQLSNGVHSWYTAPSGTAGNAISFTQAMTLDASGNLLVGTTSSDAKLVSKSGSTTVAAARFDTGVAGDVGQSPVYVVKYDNNTTSSQGFIKFYINDGGAASGVITANGANAATFTSTSDARLKENITALPDQLANICALKPSEFDYKDGSGRQIGFIAQEMQEIYPDVVSEGEDGMLMISGWSKTEARLVKAIQELSAELNELKQRIH